jgi:hypothetical protein
MEDRQFQIKCNASEDGQLYVKTNSLSVRIGQLICRNGSAEMWDSIIVVCQSNEDGSLTSKVIVCHPDWDQHLQIANVQSHFSDREQPSPALQFDLKPVRV